MKNLSQELLNHLTGDNLTVAILWEIKRKDGYSVRFTNHDDDIDFNGFTYISSSGFTPSSIDSSSDLSTDNMEMKGFLLQGGSLGSFNLEFFTVRDILNGVWDSASVKISLVNFTDLASGEMILKTGTIGNIKTGRGFYDAEVRGLTQKLQQYCLRTIQKNCDATLGDSRCKVNLANFTFTGSVVEVVNNRAFKMSITRPSQSLADGVITFTSGANIDAKRTVYLNEDDKIVLYLETLEDIKVGDEFTVSAGCDKTISTCKNKFNNVINFRGFPYIPTIDDLVGIGKDKKNEEVKPENTSPAFIIAKIFGITLGK